MAVTEFVERYSGYRTEDEMEALSEAIKVHVFDKEGKEHAVLPMKFGDEWCLMLDTMVNVVRFLDLKRVEGKLQ